MRGLFVTGTDTDVGKTYLTALIAETLCQQNRSIGVYKPVCSGAVEKAETREPIWTDLERHYEALQEQYPREWICPQCFAAPLAPPVAAQLEDRQVDEELLTDGLAAWDGVVEGILVEGVGGWKAPISESWLVEDLAVELGFPVLVVAAQKLGAINHTLLTIDAIQQAGLPIAGVVVNQVSPEAPGQLATNAEQIQKFAGLKLISHLQFDARDPLQNELTSSRIDWWELLAESQGRLRT